MTKQEFEEIKNQQTDLKNLPNTTLISSMDKLSTDFETIKESIIQQTIYLDEVESLYNNILKEFQSRGQ
jgi:hypothetical protein